MAIVYDSLVAPDGTPLEGIKVNIRLFSGDDLVAGFVDTPQGTILSTWSAITDDDGYFEVDLEPNDDINPPSTHYVVHFLTQYPPTEVAFHVPASPAGPHWLGDLILDIQPGEPTTRHEAAANPHPQYATDTDLAVHAAAPDSHPGYLTPAEGDLAYDVAGAASTAVSSHTDTDASLAALHHTLGLGANQAATGNHDHTTLDILGFSPRPVFNVADYGGDIQATVTAATAAAPGGLGRRVYIPEGAYSISSQITVDGGGTSLEIYGDGAGRTILNWTGATSGTCLFLDGLKRFWIHDFALVNTVAVGTTRGLHISRSTGTGTQSFLGRVDGISAQGFATGVQCGTTSIPIATSEIAFTNLSVNSNTIGVLLEAANSLDFTFINLNMASNGTGLQATSAGEVWVYGGSASFNGTDFMVQTGGTYSIHGFRSEHAGRFLYMIGTTVSHLGMTLTGCLVVASTGTDAILGMTNFSLTALNCAFSDAITVGNGNNAIYGANLTLIGCGIDDTEPFIPNPANANYQRLTYLVQGCRRYSNGSHIAVFPDEMGVCTATARVPFLKHDPTTLALNVASQANGQSLGIKSLTELVAITNTATTDTTIQLPAGALILAVSARVTVAIPTATTFTVGDSGNAARFSTAAVSVAANTTDRGTAAGAYYNPTATAVRITPNATPAANTGRVRVTIHFLDVTVPTS